MPERTPKHSSNYFNGPCIIISSYADFYMKVPSSIVQGAFEFGETDPIPSLHLGFLSMGYSIENTEKTYRENLQANIF